MAYRPYSPPALLLFGYDPVRDLPLDHLARLIEQVVEASVVPTPRPHGPGQAPFDPRLCLKLLTYGYATGIRSSRQLERLCHESLPFLFLTRGDAPSYRTLCSFRVEQADLLEQVWVGLFAVADALGLKRLGHVVIDSTKRRADARPEAVLTAQEYAPVREELLRILAEAATVDTQEAQEGRPGATRLGQTVDPEQMRDVLRRVRRRLAKAKRQSASPPAPSAEDAGEAPASEAAADPDGEGADAPLPPMEADVPEAAVPEADPAPSRWLGARMRERVTAAVSAIDQAMAEGRKHLCLTDPDARMMAGGRDHKIQECHRFEVAVDREAGLLVVAQTCPEASDNARLEAVVEAAARHEPEGVKAADADCGYFSGGGVGRLMRAGIDTCIPDSSTACDLHRGQAVGTTRAKARGQVLFEYDAATDTYRCPEGNELRRVQRREEGGQEVREYRARRRCLECPRAGECLTQAKAEYRTVAIGEYEAELREARERFKEAEHQERYRHRGEVVERVFAVLRGALGYNRWQVRGGERVASEGRLFGIAYQVRKLHARWRAA